MCNNKKKLIFTQQSFSTPKRKPKDPFSKNPPILKRFPKCVPSSKLSTDAQNDTLLLPPLENSEAHTMRTILLRPRFLRISPNQLYASNPYAFSVDMKSQNDMIWEQQLKVHRKCEASSFSDTVFTALPELSSANMFAPEHYERGIGSTLQRKHSNQALAA